MRKFIDCFFIRSQINTKEKSLYCNNLFEDTVEYENQIERLRECEYLLVVIELGAWLNDYNVILQSIVTIYGYLVPLIYYSTAFEPITKVKLIGNFYERINRKVKCDIKYQNHEIMIFLISIIEFKRKLKGIM